MHFHSGKATWKCRLENGSRFVSASMWYNHHTDRLWLLRPSSPKHIFTSRQPPMPHICVSESDHHWMRLWLVAYSVPSHYLNQLWVIVNLTLRQKLQWYFTENTKRFIHDSENISLRNGGHGNDNDNENENDDESNFHSHIIHVTYLQIIWHQQIILKTIKMNKLFIPPHIPYIDIVVAEVH